LGGAIKSFDHPTWSRVVLVAGTTLAGIAVAGQQIPTREKRLHPTDSLGVQTQLLNHVVDVPHPANIFVGKKAVTRSRSVSDDEPFVFVFSDRRYRQTHLLGQDTNGNHRIVELALGSYVSHHFFCNCSCTRTI
jgi:hypothetical protein